MSKEKQPRPSSVIIRAEALRNLPEVHDGLFRVAEDGRIYRRHGDGYRLTSQFKTSRDGRYFAVAATVDGKQKHYLVHRLVAMAYIPNPENKPEVNHKDCNGHNNHVSNLEWATRRENCRHAYQNGLIPTTATHGAPCMSCGAPTLRESRICRTCEVKAKMSARKDAIKDQKADTVLSILDRVDIATVSARDQEILRMYSEGATLQSIGDRFFISRERVRQIIRRYAARECTPQAISPRQQEEIAAYIKGMGFKKSHLANSLDICYSSFSKMMSMQSPMRESVFEKLCELVKFEVEKAQ